MGVGAAAGGAHAQQPPSETQSGAAGSRLGTGLAAEEAAAAPACSACSACASGLSRAGSSLGQQYGRGTGNSQGLSLPSHTIKCCPA